MPIIEGAKDAVVGSYLRPVMYKNNILFKGIVIVRYVDKSVYKPSNDTGVFMK